MKTNHLPLYLFLQLLVVGSSAQENVTTRATSADITASELREHVRYLASDELGGRKTGEEGNRMAASYIAKEFASYGLKPYGDNGTYMQAFPFLSEIRPGKQNSLGFTVSGKKLSFALDEDFRPLSSSSDTSFAAPVVFAGYGIAADSLHYNDYDGIDVRNAVVVAFRYSPEGAERDSVYTKYSPILVKAFTAREKGAAALILVTGPLDSKEPVLMNFKLPQNASAGIGMLTMKWSALETLLARAGKDVHALQRQINETKKPASFRLENATAEVQTQVERVYGTSQNIIGFLEGTDPLLKSEALVIGAHMDHLGMGGEGSGSLRPDTSAIHHGADDNASGTAGLLEVAQYLAANRSNLKRSVIFASFSGEELGVIGSEFYVQHPSFPLDQTVAMVNMDMIGRLKDSLLVVEGMGTSPSFEQLVRSDNADSLQLRLKPDGYGPSDHASFYGKNLPVMFFFTNLHSDYHRPSDTWDKINYAGEEKVVKLVGRVSTKLLNESVRPQFTKVVMATSMGAGGDRQGVRVSLGVVPDYAEDAAGMKISGTRPGSAAEKAGLKGGDILISFGGKSIKNIYDFTYLLGEYKPGDVVTIIVKRGAEEVTLSATLDARK